MVAFNEEWQPVELAAGSRFRHCSTLLSSFPRGQGGQRMTRGARKRFPISPALAFHANINSARVTIFCGLLSLHRFFQTFFLFSTSRARPSARPRFEEVTRRRVKQVPSCHRDARVCILVERLRKQVYKRAEHHVERAKYRQRQDRIDPTRILRKKYSKDGVHRKRRAHAPGRLRGHHQVRTSISNQSITES